MSQDYDLNAVEKVLHFYISQERVRKYILFYYVPFVYFLYIHKKDIFTLQITTLTKLNTTILLERFPGEQSFCFRPAAFDKTQNLAHMSKNVAYACFNRAPAMVNPIITGYICPGQITINALHLYSPCFLSHSPYNRSFP